MIFPGANRLYIRRLLRTRTIKILLFIFCLVNVLDVLRVHSSIAKGERQRLQRSSSTAFKQQKPHERVYIAGIHWNNGKILRSHWKNAVLDLAETFGRDNVFVSAYESGSWDDSKEVIKELEDELIRRKVPHRVEVSYVTHHDEIMSKDKGEGWIDTARGKRELRRIPYLARLRNNTLKDLVELSEKGITFDKVLFLNDVVFTTDDVLTLMNTNSGEYAAACSTDYSKPPSYYDTFALRDIEGQSHIMHTWPYFKAGGSRSPMVNNMDAVPVRSCWNGIIAMAAEPFISSTKLRFRGVPDTLAEKHLEGSECCLIHADNPLSKTRGVYVNPRVRVGYNAQAYDAVHPAGSWVSTWEVFTGLWTNRLLRWSKFTFERWAVRRRVAAWEKEAEGNREPGEFCLINEMQILVDRGWLHV